MKPMNWISSTGFKPCAAMPTASPAIIVSASGVSITRLKPKVSRRPAVARNTPPLTPTSSPSTTTSRSSYMARCRARLIASSRVSLASLMAALLTSGDARAQHGARLGQRRRPLRIDVVEQRVERLRTGLFEGLHRLLYQTLALADQRLLAALVPLPLGGEKGLLDLGGRAIAGGVVGGGVVAEAVADALQQHRALAMAGTLQGDLHALVNGDDVVAVDLLAGKTGTYGLLRQCRRAALNAPRHRDRPLVIVDHEDHRQLPGAGDVERLEEVALAGRAIAAGGDGDPVLAADLHRRGHAASVQDRKST